MGTALIAPEVLSAYNNYHFALKYKLKCASQYLNNLTDILTGTSLQDISADKELIMFNINMNMDGFFYSSGSALDILAREVLSYYGQTLPNRVYFHTAYNELNQHRPQEAIVQKLVTPAWKNLFSDYRNALTHELIVADRLSIQVITQGSKEQVNLRLPLPDDPKVRPEDTIWLVV